MANFRKAIFYLLYLLFHNIYCQSSTTSYPASYSTALSTILPTITNLSGEYYTDIDITYDYDGQDMQIECNHPELCYIECDGYYECSRLNVTTLSEVSNIQIQCNGESSCDSMHIHQLTAISLDIECTEDSSCRSFVLDTSVISNMTLYCGRNDTTHNYYSSCAYAKLYESDIKHLVIECMDMYSCQSMEIYNNSATHAHISCSGDVSYTNSCNSMKYYNNTGNNAEISCKGEYTYSCRTAYWDLIDYNQVSLTCDDAYSCHNLELICPVHNQDNTCSIECNNDYSCNSMQISLLDDELDDYFDLQCNSGAVSNSACYQTDISCQSSIHNTDVSTSISTNECSNIFCCPWSSVIDELNDIEYCQDDEHCNLMCNLDYTEDEGPDILYECGGVVDAYNSLSLMMSCGDPYVCDHTTVICPQYGDCTINCNDQGCGYLVINSTLSKHNTINLLCNNNACQNIVLFSSQSTSQISIMCNDGSCLYSQFHVRDADNVIIYAMGELFDEYYDYYYAMDRRRLAVTVPINIPTLSNAWIDVSNTGIVDIFASGVSLQDSIIFGNESSAINIVCPQYSCYDTDIYCPSHLENSCNVICDSCNGTVIHFDYNQTALNWFNLALYNGFSDVQMECNNNDTTSFSLWQDQVVCNNDICCPFTTYDDVVIGDISIPSDNEVITTPLSRFQVSAQVYIKSELEFDAECTHCFEWFVNDLNIGSADESVTLYNTKIGSYVTDDKREEYDIFEAHLVIRSVLDENAGYCYEQNQSDIHIIQPGTSYQVRLDIFEANILNYTIYQSDTISVSTAEPPSGGYCRIVNNDDIRVFSNFSIECSGWESYVSDEDSQLRYNALIQDVPFLDDFTTDPSLIRGIVGIGDIEITALIQDNSSFTACYVINTTFPSLREALDGNDSITDMEADITELLQQTQPNHIMISIYSAIDALYRHNESLTAIEIWINTLIDEIISRSSNETVHVAVEHVLSDLTTLKTLTSNPNIIELETVSNIAESYFDYISESINEYVINDTINPDTLYSFVTENQKIIHNLENVMKKESTTNISNHLSYILVDKSLLFAHLSLLKSFPGEFYRFISDTIYSEKIISATKFENVYNSSSNITHQCGYNNQFLQIPTKFNQQNIGIFDCAFVASTDNFMVNNREYKAVSDLVSVKIYNNLSAIIQETDSCNPYLIAININNKSVLNNNNNDYTLDDDTIFPKCNFWTEESLWSQYGCVVHEFSADGDTVICACQHLTIFEISEEDFILEANVIAQYDVRSVTIYNLERYPVVWATILIVGVLMIMLCLWNPIKHDRSSLAYEDIIFTKVRDERLKNDIAGKEIEIIEKYLPNAHFIGRGITKMAQDKSGTKSLCLLQFNLYYIYLRNDHTLWSIFQRTSGTNFSTKQRIGCFFMYLSLIMVSSALFYGKKQNTAFGDVTASFIISLCSTVPVFFVKKLFINSKPKIIKRTIHINGEDEGEIDETEQKKDIEDDDVEDYELEYNKHRETKRMSSTYYKSLNSIKENKTRTKVSTLYTALAEVNKAHSKQHRIKLVDEVRKTLYNTIYPFKHKYKLYSWIMIAIITLICCIVAIIYGLKFDAQYLAINNPDYSRDITLFDEECWDYNKQLWTEYSLSMDKIEELRDELKSTFIDNYANCSESTKWLISCAQSLLLSLFLWQPLNIFIMTFIKILMFTWNLKMRLTPRNVVDLLRYCCCGKSVPDIDDGDTEMAISSYLAISNKNRPLDIIGYLSNDILFLKTNDLDKRIELVSPKCNEQNEHENIEIEMNATNGKRRSIAESNKISLSDSEIRQIVELFDSE